MKTSETLWRSARNIMDSSQNLHALLSCVESLIAAMPEFTDSESEKLDADWLVPVQHIWFKYRGVKRKNTVVLGHVTIAIQLCSDGPENVWPQGAQAKLLAGYVPQKDYWWTFDETAPGADGSAEDTRIDGPLWRDDRDGSWFFAVPLDELTSGHVVEELVIAPLVALIKDPNAKDAFAGIEDRICMPPAPPLR